MRRIAILNAKGGVGKTTTSVNLAVGLAGRGHRVLLIDVDPQGHVGTSLGCWPGENSLAELLVEAVAPEDCIRPSFTNLSTILSDQRLEKAARILAGEYYRETKIKRLLAGIEGYDFVICDCAPGVTLLNQNVLMFCDEVFVPVSMEFLAMCGLSDIEAQLEEARTMTAHDVHISLVIPTFYDGRNRKSKEVLDSLRSRFGDKVAEPIRINSRLSEAAAAHRPIFLYDPDSNGAKDYTVLAEEVLARGEATTSQPGQRVG